MSLIFFIWLFYNAVLTLVMCSFALRHNLIPVNLEGRGRSGCDLFQGSILKRLNGTLIIVAKYCYQY
jgi:hypothetical protein